MFISSWNTLYYMCTRISVVIRTGASARRAGEADIITIAELFLDCYSRLRLRHPQSETNHVALSSVKNIIYYKTHTRTIIIIIISSLVKRILYFAIIRVHNRILCNPHASRWCCSGDLHNIICTLYYMRHGCTYTYVRETCFFLIALLSLNDSHSCMYTYVYACA